MKEWMLSENIQWFARVIAASNCRQRPLSFRISVRLNLDLNLHLNPSQVLVKRQDLVCFWNSSPILRVCFYFHLTNTTARHPLIFSNDRTHSLAGFPYVNSPFGLCPRCCVIRSVSHAPRSGILTRTASCVLCEQHFRTWKRRSSRYW